MSLQRPQKLWTRTCEFEGSSAGKGHGDTYSNAPPKGGRSRGLTRQVEEVTAQSPVGKTGPEQKGGLRTCVQSRVEKIIWETEQM